MITAQSANFKTLLQNRAGRGLILQAYIENVADVLCTQSPPDVKSKTYAVNFHDTDSEYADLGTNTALTNLADWTVCAWAKVKAGQAHPIISWWDAGANKGMYVSTDASNYVVTRFSGSAEQTLSASVALGDETWTFLGVSLGGNGKTVLRGVIGNTDIAAQYFAVTRASRNSFTGGTLAYLGRADTTYMDGDLAVVQVFSRALTHKEMRRVKYRILTAAWGNDDSAGLWNSLVAQYEMERNAGTTLVNSKTPGTHDGTLTNGPTWHSDQCYSVTYRPSLSVETSIGQSIDPLATRTSIQGATLKVLDTDEWFTTVLKDTTLGLLRRDIHLHLGFVGLAESEYQPIYVGKIADVSYANAAYTIRCGDALFDGKVKQQLGRSVLNAQCLVGAVQADVTNSSAMWFDSPNLSGSTGYLKMDSEIAGYVSFTGGAGFIRFGDVVNNLVRGQFGTTDATHASGAMVEEHWIIDGTHPLTFALRFMLSSGGLEGVNGYDVFNEFLAVGAAVTRQKRGLGMSPSDVAIAEIEGLRDTDFAGYQIRLFIDEDIADSKDLIEKELLRPLGCYFFTKPDGRLSIASHKIPVAGDVVHMINPEQCKVESWEVTRDDIVNWVEVEYDWNPATEEYDGIYVATDATSAAAYGIEKRDYTFKGVDAAYSPTTILDALKTDIFARFKNPYVTCVVRCPLTEMFVEIGDAVYFTAMSLPNVTTGFRGIHEQIWQVVGRKLDIRAGTVTLTLADLSRA